ncbi:Pre-mRNA cleavage factor Im subunit 1 [Zea mays]|uniref:Pre-mRNA cleavage factor Im 25 kDa subunit n=2 Tax=Zea mays TaxID=4577 RepID=A0A3L6F7W6_MAIZE|nr:cleavage and polyadenylation specificity factor 5 [Zea mays]PWZ04324.1 Pre-mRNA cleavage factor Im subunit 1 [Zea mays]PWZ27153.1 Pre-mRNA cleavage factor Im subunit 1 [Zea mays]PWZ29008.1 Pre-mRNA cleavage factor Im subunit 1 [Zea mays]
MGLEMVEVMSETVPTVVPAAARENGVDIYPLSRYYFGARDAAGVPRGLETAADRALRLKANFAAHGLRTSVHGVLLVELFDHPHVLLLQVRNSSFLLPGGRLRPGEEEVRGLKRKLSSKLSVVDDAETVEEEDWQIGQCIGMWWRSEFEAIPFPYMPPRFRAAKECMKLFLIRLPMSRQFIVPRNMKLLAVPLSQIHGNAQVYGPIVAGIPSLLSKFSFNVISD